MITAIEFVTRYVEWLEGIDHCIAQELYPAIKKMYCRDPHDLITPHACFASECHAIGFIWCELIKTHKQLLQEAK